MAGVGVVDPIRKSTAVADTDDSKLTVTVEATDSGLSDSVGAAIVDMVLGGVRLSIAAVVVDASWLVEVSDVAVIDELKYTVLVVADGE